MLELLGKRSARKVSLNPWYCKGMENLHIGKNKNEKKQRRKGKNEIEGCRSKVQKKFGVPSNLWTWLIGWLRSTERKINKRRRRKWSVVSTTIHKDLYSIRLYDDTFSISPITRLDKTILTFRKLKQMLNGKSGQTYWWKHALCPPLKSEHCIWFQNFKLITLCVKM